MALKQVRRRPEGGRLANVEKDDDIPFCGVRANFVKKAKGFGA